MALEQQSPKACSDVELLTGSVERWLEIKVRSSILGCTGIPGEYLIKEVVIQCFSSQNRECEVISHGSHAGRRCFCFLLHPEHPVLGVSPPYPLLGPYHHLLLPTFLLAHTSVWLLVASRPLQTSQPQLSRRQPSSWEGFVLDHGPWGPVGRHPVQSGKRPGFNPSSAPGHGA